MRRIPAVVTGALAALILAGCAQQNPPLYMWDKFPRQQYDFLLGDGADLGKQIDTLEGHSRKAREKAQRCPRAFARIWACFI